MSPFSSNTNSNFTVIMCWVFVVLGQRGAAPVASLLAYVSLECGLEGS